MRFNSHSSLVGKHAILSASQYHWIRYDDDKMLKVIDASVAARRGTALHALASEAIKWGVKLAPTKQTLNLYVNDCIGFRLRPEQLLFYSNNAFGTADAIGFDDLTKTLRIFDLKTGVNAGSEDQLYIYAAFFCLEYDIKPFDIVIELRIYQNDEVKVFDGDPDTVTHIMSKIITFDKLIEADRMEAL